MSLISFNNIFNLSHFKTIFNKKLQITKRANSLAFLRHLKLNLRNNTKRTLHVKQPALLINQRRETYSIGTNNPKVSSPNIILTYFNNIILL